jgi:hypothetical protein
MEFDDIKTLWNHSAGSDAGELKVDDVQEKLSSVLKQKNRIKLSFRVELLIVAVVYTGFIILVLFYGKAVQPYMYKMVTVVTVLGLPVLLRLYKAIQWQESLDFSQDIRSYLLLRIKHLRTTLTFYRWTSYGIIVITLVIFFTDASFNVLPLYLKSIIVTYLGVFAVFLGPYIKRMYGDKVTLMEDLLKE